MNHFAEPHFLKFKSSRDEKHVFNRFFDVLKQFFFVFWWPLLCQRSSCFDRLNMTDTLNYLMDEYLMY